jgi:hypothetical protein
MKRRAPSDETQEEPPEETQEDKVLVAVVKLPGKRPERIELPHPSSDDFLPTLQLFVHGNVEHWPSTHLPPEVETLTVYVNEDGRCRNMPVNWFGVRGPLVVVGPATNAGDATSLSDAQIQQLMLAAHEPPRPQEYRTRFRIVRGRDDLSWFFPSAEARRNEIKQRELEMKADRESLTPKERAAIRFARILLTTHPLQDYTLPFVDTSETIAALIKRCLEYGETHGVGVGPIESLVFEGKQLAPAALIRDCGFGREVHLTVNTMA